MSLDNLQVYHVRIILSPMHDDIGCWYWVIHVADTVMHHGPSMSKQMNGKWMEILSPQSCTAFSVLSNSSHNKSLGIILRHWKTCPMSLNNLQIYCVCIILSPTHDDIGCWYWVTHVATAMTRHNPSKSKQMEWKSCHRNHALPSVWCQFSSHNKSLAIILHH